MSRFLQISGRLEKEKEMKLGEDWKVLVSVYAIEERDQQNGEVDIIYKGKLFDVLEDEQ